MRHSVQVRACVQRGGSDALSMVERDDVTEQLEQLRDGALHRTCCSTASV